jgi:hypothetical protein
MRAASDGITAPKQLLVGETGCGYRCNHDRIGSYQAAWALGLEAVAAEFQQLATVRHTRLTALMRNTVSQEGNDSVADQTPTH